MWQKTSWAAVQSKVSGKIQNEEIMMLMMPIRGRIFRVIGGWSRRG